MKKNLKKDQCKKCSQYLDGWRRAKADYANLQREFERQRMQMTDYIKSMIIKDLIPVYDNFKEAFNHIESENQKKDWVVGIGHIKKQLEEYLKKIGVEEIKTVGHSFDPALHEAVGTRKQEGKSEGEIIEELKGGYQINGKTLSAAKVIVAE